MSSRSEEFRARLRDGRPLICDGGMGAELLKRGWEGPTEEANLHAPAVVEELHRAYRSAGAEILLTNTFMVSRRDEDEIGKLIKAGVARARAAANGAFVVGSLGPPSDGSDERLIKLARAFAEQEVDALLFETFDQILWGLCSVVGQHFDGPVLVSFRPLPSLVESVRDWSGRDDFLATQKRPDAVGFNCGDGPAPLLHAARMLVDDRADEVDPPAFPPPLMLRPSAGLPTGKGRSLAYPIDPVAFADFAVEANRLGARIIGGCCGASPEHIAALASRLRSIAQS